MLINMVSKFKKETMKNYAVNNEKEEKNKKRGFLITLFFHTALVAMAFFPLMGAINDIALDEPAVQYIELTDPTSNDVDFVANADTKARKNASNKQAESPAPKTKNEPTPTPTPTPKPEPSETVNDDVDPLPTSDDNSSETNQDENPTQETPKVAPIPTTTPSGNQSNSSKTGGTANTNTHNSGDGGDDSELSEGVFGRKVKFRPNIKGLTKKKGKIAIKVCVSQEGTVIASKFLRKFSTIYDAKLIANAMRATRRYRFDVDYTAPKRQWGKLTFIFDID